MNPEQNHKFLYVKTQMGKSYWYLNKKQDAFLPFDESNLTRLYPGYQRFHEKARAKIRKDFLSRGSILKKFHLSNPLPNSHKKLRVVYGTKPSQYPTQEDLQIGTKALLRIAELFPKRELGYNILSILLCGLRCQALRMADPDFHPAINIDNNAPEIREVFTSIVNAAVTRKKWKGSGCTLRRSAILDYQKRKNFFPRHIQDFTDAKLKLKKYPSLHIPVPYVDTVALVIGADRAELHAAEPILEGAAVFLLNCGKTSWEIPRLRSLETGEYLAELVDLLTEERYRVAAVLNQWWAEIDDDPTWAIRIMKAAKQSLGKPDQKYATVTFKRKLIDKAIYHKVLTSFWEMLEQNDILPADILRHYRDEADDIYAPKPIPKTPVRHMEDPGVFLEIMRKLAVEKPTAPLSGAYRKSDKLLGAWRDIGGKRYLVMEESVWAHEYKKAAHSRSDVDCSFAQNASWIRDLQAILANCTLIKQPSAGCRYRYDLFQNGTRDKTYVLAVPADLLIETSTGQTAGQHTLPSGNTVCPDSCPE